MKKVLLAVLTVTSITSNVHAGAAGRLLSEVGDAPLITAGARTAIDSTTLSKNTVAEAWDLTSDVVTRFDDFHTTGRLSKTDLIDTNIGAARIVLNTSNKGEDVSLRLFLKGVTPEEQMNLMRNIQERIPGARYIRNDSNRGEYYIEIPVGNVRANVEGIGGRASLSEAHGDERLVGRIGMIEENTYLVSQELMDTMNVLRQRYRGIAIQNQREALARAVVVSRYADATPTPSPYVDTIREAAARRAAVPERVLEVRPVVTTNDPITNKLKIRFDAFRKAMNGAVKPGAAKRTGDDPILNKREIEGKEWRAAIAKSDAKAAKATAKRQARESQGSR